MTRLYLGFFLATATLLAACPDPGKRGIGSTCSDDEQCASGACIAGTCLDPEADEDGDGLINRVEGALGTDPNAADTDGDGVGDLDEIVDQAAPLDSDGDGNPDALESSTGDADDDCIADQFDPNDAAPETDPALLADAVCDTDGVCAGAATASCPAGATEAICDFSAIADHEAEEITCDGMDNDCDGDTDEPFAAGGTITFDGGQNPADADKALGDTCGAGACAGGVVQCTASGNALTCSTSDQIGAPACTGDADCNGVDDLSQVASGTEDLEGCVGYYSDPDDDDVGDGVARCLCAVDGDYSATVAGDCDSGNELIYPGAPGICGEDADCDDDLKDESEDCDDSGNTDVDDGCYECQVTEKAMHVLGTYAGQPRVANLTDGGFVVGYDDGQNSPAEADYGRVLGFFDATGKRIARIEGLGLTPPRTLDYRWDLVAVADGDVIYGQWQRNIETGNYAFVTQRYSALGEPEGEPLTIVPDEPNGSYRFELVALGAGGYAFVYDSARGTAIVNYVTADDKLASTVAEVDIDWRGVAGYPDGSLVFVINNEGFYGVQWLGADGQLVGEPTIVEPPADHYFQDFDVAALATGGAVVFIVGERYELEQSFTFVGYQRFAADATRDGELQLFTDADTEGCPYEIQGEVDSTGNPFAALADGECGSRARGWYAIAGSVVALDLASERHADNNGGLDMAGGARPIFVFDHEPELVDNVEIFLRRYDTSARPIYLPDPMR